MVFFNYALRKLNAKIVYYGPGLCGKTTNLQWIHDHFEGGQRGKMISLATEGDRTIFFDLLPIDIGTIRGMDVTLQLYTVPGQVHYNSTRQLVLRGADGVVFVADSQRTMRASNIESYENLQENLMLQGIDLQDFPHCLQFNKRDLRDLLSTEDLNESLNEFSVPIFEAVATEGIGVQETLEGIVKLVMRNLREKYEPVASAGGPKAPKPMQVGGPVAFQATPAPGAAAPAPPPPTDDGSGAEAEFGTFQSEDEIATSVYEGQDDETGPQVPAFDAPDFDAKTPVIATEPEPETEWDAGGSLGDVGGIFTDPRDEDGTEDQSPMPAFPPMPPADEPAEPAADLSTDPEIDPDSLQAAGGDESMEDLFETEVPSVKSFVEESRVSERVQGTSPPGGVFAETGGDRFEDRIEAPGPFAPHPVADRPAEPEPEPEPPYDDDQEAVSDEVRQALGASEDREALASLTAAERAAEEADVEFTDQPDEAEREVAPPFAPPPASEPGPSDTIRLEPPAEDPFHRLGAEKAVGEPAVEEPIIDEPVLEEPDVEEPDVEEPATDAPQPRQDRLEAPPPVEPAAPASEPAEQPASPPPPRRSRGDRRQPVVLSSGDPFADVESVKVVPAATSVIPTGGVDVTADGNQLHLQLRGSGAIAQMGQVRALDIEVPVPGKWVGNRKVTLQLRLTLTPAEDEDG